MKIMVIGGGGREHAIIQMLKSDLLEIMMAVQSGRLKEISVEFENRSACCVILASKGYPGKYESGCPLHLPKAAPDCFIYVAGAKKKDGILTSAGGRVLGVTAVGDSLPEAIRRAYTVADQVDFKNGYCRRDIGKRALKAFEK